MSTLNAGFPFTTDFRGSNDVTITETAGVLSPVYTDEYGRAGSLGNNPDYLVNFVGNTDTGTGDGTPGDLTSLDLNVDEKSNVSLQFDFVTPIGTSDRILIADVDSNEHYRIQAYARVNGTYTALSLTGWIHEPFSGQTGITPDDTWPTRTLRPGP